MQIRRQEREYGLRHEGRRQPFSSLLVFPFSLPSLPPRLPPPRPHCSLFLFSFLFLSVSSFSPFLLFLHHTTLTSAPSSISSFLPFIFRLLYSFCISLSLSPLSSSSSTISLLFHILLLLILLVPLFLPSLSSSSSPSPSPPLLPSVRVQPAQN